MSRYTRRGFVRSAAVAGVGAGAIMTGGRAAAGAASHRYTAPAFIRAQNAPVEISFYHIWGTPPGGQDPEALHPAVRVIDLFNENQPDIRVNSVTPSGDYTEMLQKAQADMAAGNVPALIATPWAFLYTAREGLGIQDLAELYGDGVSELMGQMNPMVHEIVTTEEGEILGVPYAFSTPIWYYNAELYEQAGVDPAEAFATWESFAEAAPTLQEALGGDNPVFGFATNRDWPAQTIIQSNGGQVLRDGEPVMNSAEAQAAMQTIAELDAAGYHDRGAVPEIGPTWVSGVTATMQASVASLAGVRRDAPFEVGTASFPRFEGKDRQASAGGSFIGMYAQEKEQQDAAWEYMKFALSEEPYMIWMETGYLNITNLDVPVLEGQEAAYKQLEEGLTSETQWPGQRGTEAAGVWATYCERIWANDISVEEGTNAAVEEISSLLGI